MPMIMKHSPKVLGFVGLIPIRKSSLFQIKSFYNESEDNKVQLYFNDDFKSLIYTMKDEFVCLKNSKLRKYAFEKEAGDLHAHQDFNISYKPVIPVRIFLAQLRELLLLQPLGEERHLGLSVDQKNVFNIGLPPKMEENISSVSVRSVPRPKRNAWTIKLTNIANSPVRRAGTLFYSLT